MFSWHAGNKKNNCYRLVCANFDSSFQTFWVFWIIIRMVVLYSSYSYRDNHISILLSTDCQHTGASCYLLCCISFSIWTKLFNSKMLYSNEAVVELYSQGVPDGPYNKSGINWQTGQNFYEKQVFAIVRDTCMFTHDQFMRASSNGMHSIFSWNCNVHTNWYTYKHFSSSHTLKFVSLAFLIGFYARDCFSNVTTEYVAFNRFLNNYLVNKMRNKVEKKSALNHESQRNTAFQVSLEDNTGDDDKPVSLVIVNKRLKWKINRLIWFLDKNDTPYITSKFFFDTCYLQQAGDPGPLFTSLLRATQRFLITCVFLFVVVVVILAFGEEYGISATNQMFATLAGGFLQYILRFVLFKHRNQLPLILTIWVSRVNLRKK
jgi:hypothetical protein